MKTQGKITSLIALTIIGAMAFTQCAQRSEDGQTAEKDADKQEESVVEEIFTAEGSEDEKVTGKDVNRKFNAAFETATEQVDQQIDELAQAQAIKRMERTAEKLDRKIVELEASLDERDLSDKAKKELKELKALQRDLNDQLEQVQEATADKWDEVKKETKEAYQKSETAIKQEVEKIEELLAENRK